MQTLSRHSRPAHFLAESRSRRARRGEASKLRAVELRVTLLADGARLPSRAHEGDAGLDLHAAEAATIEPGERAAVGTGIAVEIPPRHAGLVLPRSGLAARYGIALVNAPGLIDSGYRGEVRVLLLKPDRDGAFEVRHSDRIAQLVVTSLPHVVLVAVAELADSAGRDGGLGSSGR